MRSLSFWSLALLALAPLLGVGDLGFWEILRLAAVVVGLAWLLWRHRRGEGVPWAGLVVPLVFMFILTQFIQGAGGWVLLGSFLIVALAAAGTARELRPLSRLDHWVLAIGAAALAANLATQLLLGPAVGQLRSQRWWGACYLLELLLVYLAASRLVRGPGGREAEFRLLGTAGAALLVVGAAGLWQLGAATHHARQAKADFAAGRFAEAASHLAALQPQDRGLGFEPLGVEHVVGQLAAAAKSFDAWMALGDIAAQQQLWEQAQDAYRQVYQQDPLHPTVCARLGLTLLECARVDEALGLLRQGVAQPGAGAEEHLALVVALVRTGALAEANQALDAALEAGGLKASLTGRLSGNRLDASLGDLLPPLALRHARQATLFGVVSLLEHRGWQVLHPATEVGKTGVRAPIDIAAYSGGGFSSGKEQILVAGHGVSRRTRGYNIAVIG
ncbi:MAG: hypothetical protein FJX77_15650, partial [Armatimonadetes bacterium]|nr:hypothetical protein [Armatimonadota bacterium]